MRLCVAIATRVAFNPAISRVANLVVSKNSGVTFRVVRPPNKIFLRKVAWFCSGEHQED